MSIFEACLAAFAFKNRYWKAKGQASYYVEHIGCVNMFLKQVALNSYSCMQCEAKLTFFLMYTNLFGLHFRVFIMGPSRSCLASVGLSFSYLYILELHCAILLLCRFLKSHFVVPTVRGEISFKITKGVFLLIKGSITWLYNRMFKENQLVQHTDVKLTVSLCCCHVKFCEVFHIRGGGVGVACM